MKGICFNRPMIVTYSYSWMYFFKLYATIIIRFRVEYPKQPAMVSDEEIIVEVERITHTKLSALLIIARFEQVLTLSHILFRVVPLILSCSFYVFELG